MPFKPGTHFHYNTPATFMASAMVQKATGQTVLDYLRPRLFEPLGIVDPTWDANFQGISLGGYGLSLKTEDIAKFGRLLIQKGKWDGKQVVPAAWVEEATARQTSNGSNPRRATGSKGYGYQFWRCRNGAFRGDGAFGQFCLVMPDRDAVVAITSGTNDLQGVLNLVWEKLLPALGNETLPDDPEAAGKLRERLQSLSHPQAEGPGVVADPRPGRRPDLHVPLERQEARIGPDRAGHEPRRAGHHHEGRRPGAADRDQRARLEEGDDPRPDECRDRPRAGDPGRSPRSGAWTAEDTYTARVVLVETPFVLTVSMRFAGDELFYDSQVNVRGKDPQLVGREPSRP